MDSESLPASQSAVAMATEGEEVVVDDPMEEVVTPEHSPTPPTQPLLMLDQDAMRALYAYLPLPQLFRCTCKAVRAAHPERPTTYVSDMAAEWSVLRLAIDCGLLNLSRWFCIGWLRRQLCKHGHLGVIKAMYAYGMNWSRDVREEYHHDIPPHSTIAYALSYAAANGQWHVLQWALFDFEGPRYDAMKFVLETSALSSAVCKGRIDVVHWWKSNGLPFMARRHDGVDDPIAASALSLLEAAICSRSVPMLMLIDANLPLNYKDHLTRRQTSSLLRDATETGELPILEWLVDTHSQWFTGHKWHEMVVPTAVAKKHYHVLEWLHAHWPDLELYNEEVFRIAMVRHDGLDMAQWLLDRGCPFPSGANACITAAYNQNLPMLKWLHAKGSPWNYRVFAAAVEDCHDTGILEWLREKGCPWDAYVLYRKARYADGSNLEDPSDSAKLKELEVHVAVFRWLLENGCPWDEVPWSMRKTRPYEWMLRHGQSFRSAPPVSRPMAIRVVNCTGRLLGDLASDAVRTVHDLASSDHHQHVLALVLRLVRAKRPERLGVVFHLKGMVLQAVTLAGAGVGSGDALELHATGDDTDDPDSADPEEDYLRDDDVSEDESSDEEDE